MEGRQKSVILKLSIFAFPSFTELLEVVPESETVLSTSLGCVEPVMLYRTEDTHDQQAKSPAVHPSVQVSSSVGSREKRTDVGETVITI